jgi:hypothetical protein
VLLGGLWILRHADKPLSAGIVAHDHPLVGQFADFDHLAVVAEDGLAAGDTRIMHAIVEAHVMGSPDDLFKIVR